MRIFTKYILALLCGSFCVAYSSAATVTPTSEPFKYTDPETKLTLWYEWIGEGEVQTAAAKDLALIGEAELPSWSTDLFNYQFDYPFTSDSSWGNGPNATPNLKQPHQDVFTSNLDEHINNIVIPSVVEDPITRKTGNVVRIGEFSFGTRNEGENNLASLVLPNTVREIGTGAFFNCAKLQNVNLGGENSQLQTIGTAAFYKCKSLDPITIHDSVTTIGDAAFFYCEKMQKLTLGKNVKTIGNHAFYYCQLLESLDIPDSVISLGDYCFYHCNALFDECVNFGEGLQTIGDGCFILGSFQVSLPASLKSVGANAFDLQDKEHLITDIYVYADEPPTMPLDGFGTKVIDNYALGHWIYCKTCLHVPAGKYWDYKNHPSWGQWECIIDDIVDQNTPLGDLVSYAFIVPGDKLNLERDIIGRELTDSDNSDWEWSFVIADGDKINADSIPVNDFNELIISLDNQGNVEGFNFGQIIAVAKRNDGNRRIDGNHGNEFQPVDPTIAACVIVFVCPTITVVYDNEAPAAAAMLLSARKSASASENTISDLIADRASYEHRVVYNSLPKLRVEEPVNIEITKIERGEAETDGFLLDLGDSYTDGLSEDLTRSDDNSIVPTEPITNNRVIVISTALNDRTPTDIKNVELTDKISVNVAGDVITVLGAADDAVVNVFDIKGQTVYSGTSKSIRMHQRGVFVATVEDATFKISIR